ncbi:MAG: NAD(P)H-dependent amine dehydrogenase family protein [Phycisphaerales bacterium]
MPPHRILHIGLGPLGQKIVTDLSTRRLGSVVAAVDVSPALTGKHLREICPAVTDDVKILSSLDQLHDLKSIDCAVVTTASDLRACADTFRWLLSRGISAVSTCEELVWPWLRHDALAKELDALAKKHNARLLGTGVNPGAMMDAVPVFVTGVCRSVKSVEVHRIQDATTRRVPFQKKIGATLDDAAFAAGVKAGWLRHVGLGESLHFIAHNLGLHIDSWSESIDPVRADRDLACTLGPIPRGHICGVRQVGEGKRGTQTLIRLVFQAAIGQSDPQDRVIIDGEPPLDVVYRGGVHGDIATSAITLNAIDSLLQAAPGLHTMATIPMTRCTPPH